MKIEVDINAKFLSLLCLSTVLLCSLAWFMVYAFQDFGKRNKPAVAAQPVMSREEALLVARAPLVEDNLAKAGAAIAALVRVVDNNQTDFEAWEAIGELRFSAKDFNGALSSYQRIPVSFERYEEVAAKIGSTLTLLGREEEAIKVLEDLVDKSPSNFKAQAFLAIAYSQVGKVPEAKETLQRAIDLAPMPEAKSRLEALMVKLAAETVADSTSSGFESWIRSHSIVGPKIVSVDFQGEQVTISVREFPMDQMPENMRTSFMQKAWDRLGENVKTIAFYDVDRQQELYVEQRKS